MKTPEEIKKGIACCTTSHRQQPCKKCPYKDECITDADNGQPLMDALAYIEQLEEQIQLMKIQMHGDCGTCKHSTLPAGKEPCESCIMGVGRPNWEYEGLPELARKENK